MSGNKETKWYVRGQGKTLGPMLTDELRDSLAKHSLSPEDEAVRKGDHYWRPLKELNDFREVCETREAKARKVPVPPPIGSLLTKRIERKQEERKPEVTTDKLPKRPSLDNLPPVVDPIVPPKHAIALAQMMQELKEQQRLEEKILPAIENQDRPSRFYAWAAVVFVVAALLLLFRTEITRGLKSSRLPDPSPDHSIPASDPIYLPKAPLRPNRN